jgi:hypothetical protein
MMESHEAVRFTGHWTHSFEEDGADVLVYRPTHGFAFPLSRRGRETLEVDQAGQVVSGMPGPDDRLRLSNASMVALGMNRFRLEGTALPAQVIEIIEAKPDMLKLRYV